MNVHYFTSFLNMYVYAYTHTKIVSSYPTKGYKGPPKSHRLPHKRTQYQLWDISPWVIGQSGPKDPKITQVIVIAFGCPPPLVGKILLLKMPYTLVIGLGKIKPNIDPEGSFLLATFHATRMCYAGSCEKSHQKSYLPVNLESYNKDQHGKIGPLV